MEMYGKDKLSGSHVIKITNAGDKVTAIKLEDGTTYVGVIADINESQKDAKIVVRFDANFRAQFNAFQYTVTFMPNRTRFVRMHKAIETVKATYNMDTLFPMKFVTTSHPQLDVHLDGDHLKDKNGNIVSWFNAQLNAPQKLAVKSVLRADCLNMAYIINGPPGN